VGRLTAGALLGAVIAGLVGYAGWVEPRRFVVRERTLCPPGWPAALDGLRVAVLSDLHAGGPHVDAARVRQVARDLSSRRPDLVLLLGDYVDRKVLFGGREEPEAVAQALTALEAPLGRVAVLGNHDWAQEGERMRAALRSAGTHVLENAALDVGRGLWVAGTGDERERRADALVALLDVPEDAPVLLLTHDPDVFPRVPTHVSLTLAGHLHGGQVDLPGLRRRFIPSRFGERYLRGLVEEDGRLLFVTSGLGQAGLPLRLRCPPEAWILELRSAH